ncbi:double zinc ribbon domain-containing protein [Piscibacillus sp. B03]|uniref:double zinc ribbon domain-containing protein n=1 Tax=Piscibacillus sp. B03 TaxID=3457430 RepID=UPI003FCE0ED2
MNEYIERELSRLRNNKSLLLAELGQYVYYQYRIGQIYSDEINEIGQKIIELDHDIFKLQNQESNETGHLCSCGNPLNESDHYCAKCGKEVKEERQVDPVTCNQCGIEVVTQAAFCYACGTKLAHQQEGVR